MIINGNLCDYLSQDHDQNTIINVCKKNKTIIFSDRFKDILFWLISDYLQYKVLDIQNFYDSNEDKYITYVIIDKE